MKKVFFSLALAISLHTVHSQSDFAITVKGDTLIGAVQILSYDIIDRVQITIEKKKKAYTALEVRTVSFKNEIYHSVGHNNRYQFMRLIKKGYLSLYGFRIENQFSYDGRLLVKLDGGLMEVPNIGFKKLLPEFLKDCSDLRDQIKKGDFGRKELDTIISLYNTCKEVSSKQEVPSAIVQSARAKESLPSLVTLKAKIEESQLATKQDILDLLKDIDAKFKANQSVPNYLIEGLKSYIVNTDYKEYLDKLLTELQIN